MGLFARIKENNQRRKEEQERLEQQAIEERNENIRFITEEPLQEFVDAHIENSNDILLKKNEELYFTLGLEPDHNGIAWYEERTRTERVGYSGVTTNVRIMKGVSYRAGSVKPVTNTITENKVIRMGPVYLTNKRLVMLSDSAPGTIRLSSIVNIVTYSDGMRIQKDRGKDVVLVGFDGELFSILVQRLIAEL